MYPLLTDIVPYCSSMKFLFMELGFILLHDNLITPNTHQKVEINYYLRQSQQKKSGNEISMFRYHGMFQHPSS